MANYRAVATGNWSNPATWGGGAVPPNGEGHDIYSNNFAVTIDQNVNVNLLTNASNSGTFVGGGTASAGGNFTLANGVVINANINGAAANTSAVFLTGANTATINGNINLTVTGGASAVITHSSSQGLVVTGNISYTSSSVNNNTIVLSGSGSLTHSGTITGANVSGNIINITSSGSFISANSTINAGSVGTAITCGASGFITIINSVLTATNGASAISSSGTNRISGTFVNATNGQQAVNAARFVLFNQPTNAYIQHALDGINAGSFVRFYTADNNLGQANPTDVRSGVSYASGNLTGRLTIPARGAVTNGVTVGPHMPFTATRSGTTATATLTYSYPYQVGDVITVTGASNAEWNMDYTITEVVSGTSVRWTVPDTHSATAGTGAHAQTTGTATLDGPSVAAAVWAHATRTLTAGAGITAADVWSHAARTVTGGTVDTLTNAPAVPSATTIAAAVRTELTELAHLDAPVSTRSTLTAGDIPSSDIAAIKAKTDALDTERLAQAATTHIVGKLLEQL